MGMLFEFAEGVQGLRLTTPGVRRGNARTCREIWLAVRGTMQYGLEFGTMRLRRHSSLWEYSLANVSYSFLGATFSTGRAMLTRSSTTEEVMARCAERKLKLII